MALRNFWLHGFIDGRNTAIKGGPRAAGGGMDVTLYVRDKGTKKTALDILCRDDNGRLTVSVLGPDGSLLGEFVTSR